VILERDAISYPVFIKPVVPKQFAAAVWPSAQAVTIATQGLAADTEIIVSSVATFVAEARAFVLDGHVRACAVYEGAADVEDARRFAEHIASNVELPRTCVVDVGLLEDRTWAIVECNATWGAGLNGCDAPSVIECIAAASKLRR
jgi:hypothetical protein